MKSYPEQFLDCSSAEFTPKIIQTKEERVNLVCRKNKCENDGGLKIGMPAEMWITPELKSNTTKFSKTEQLKTKY
jgi:HlyD family secretion protein